MSRDVDVIAEPERAAALLHPTRLAILEALETPASAAVLAERLGQPRQRLNYHVRELERVGLVELVGERKQGSVTERTLRRSAASFAISAAALGPLGSSPGHVQDRQSSAYQIAVASQAIRDLDALREGAAQEGKRLPTMTLEVDVRFRSPEARRQFGEELTAAIAHLVTKHHASADEEGRTYKLYLGAYPKPKSAADG